MNVQNSVFVGSECMLFPDSDGLKINPKMKRNCFGFLGNSEKRTRVMFGPRIFDQKIEKEVEKEETVCGILGLTNKNSHALTESN